MNKIFTILIALFAAVVSTSAQTARVQVIHNAADPLAAVVDVYINDELALDDFAFRSATPFIDLPANTGLTLDFAPGNALPVPVPLGIRQVTMQNGDILKPRSKPAACLRRQRDLRY